MDYSEDAQNFFLNEENKKKKKELKEKFGGDFHKPDDSKLTPELENEFLNYVQQFEEQAASTEYLKVIEYLGNPVFKKLEAVNQIDLSEEIEKVMQIYNTNNINIHVVENDDVTDEEFYKFITEELPEHVMQNMRIEGMNTNYIYEEFHPNDKLDSKDTIEHLIYDFLNNSEYKDLHIANEKPLSIAGKIVSKEKFIKSFAALFEDVDKLIVREEVLFNKIEITDKSKVEADLILRYKQKSTSSEKSGGKEINKIFSFAFELVRSEYGGMDVVGYELEM
ncbi:hypothetical protein BMS3Abin04_03027 [bacterium BMS3Abin04]|nr:hypothetical protein BMS3Abin04_03027 [bacterium BMS3Abin04]